MNRDELANDDHLASARLWAVARCPYLAAALHALHPVVRLGLDTVAVDRRWRLYVDVDAVRSWSISQLGTALIHEVNHLLRDHHDRSPPLLDDLDRERWNIACDAEINDDLLTTAELDLLPGVVTPGLIGATDGQLAEEYWAHLITTGPPEAQRRGPEGSSTSATPDCGSGVDGKRREHELTDQVTGLGAVQATAVRRRVARAVANASDRGVPGGLRRWAEQHGSTVDWRRVLAASIRRATADASGATDYSYRRPSRRSTALPGIVLPTLRRPVLTVAVVLDTSASMNRGRLGAAVQEIDEILAGVGADRAHVRVIACDAAAGAAQRIRSSHDVILTGGGATDMRVGIDAALALRSRPDVIVVLSDGETAWPASPVPAHLVVALVGSVDRRSIPGWAACVEIMGS